MKFADFLELTVQEKSVYMIKLFVYALNKGVGSEAWLKLEEWIKRWVATYKKPIKCKICEDTGKVYSESGEPYRHWDTMRCECVLGEAYREIPTTKKYCLKCKRKIKEGGYFCTNPRCSQYEVSVREKRRLKTFREDYGLEPEQVVNRTQRDAIEAERRKDKATNPEMENKIKEAMSG